MQQLFRLRRYLERPPHDAAGCELCGAALVGGHAHVVDVEQRRLLCTCRPCYLLFTNSGAARGRFRSVAERVVKLEAFGGGGWERLEIPVGIAFFLRDSTRNRITAFYPSPAGATESGLPVETWAELVEAAPMLDTLEADTEAVLVCRRDQGIEAWIVPVDACYELVGRIRREWKGFDGGGEAWREIDEFLTGVREREGSCA
jgi:Family of unknown function (DUF5947)